MATHDLLPFKTADERDRSQMAEQLRPFVAALESGEITGYALIAVRSSGTPLVQHCIGDAEVSKLLWGALFLQNELLSGETVDTPREPGDVG